MPRLLRITKIPAAYRVKSLNLQIRLCSHRELRCRNPRRSPSDCRHVLLDSDIGQDEPKVALVRAGKQMREGTIRQKSTAQQSRKTSLLPALSPKRLPETKSTAQRSQCPIPLGRSRRETTGYSQSNAS